MIINGKPAPLGKKAPRFDKRTLRLSKYLGESLPTPPYLTTWRAKISEWGMMLNDSEGDCTCAAAGHMVKQWTTYAGTPFTPSDDDVQKMYEVVSGYNPADPSTDQGTDMLTVLNYWRADGLASHKITAFASIEPGNRQQIEDAIYLFGNVYAGVQLPLSCQGQATWEVPQEGTTGDGTPGSWGGHCVPIVSYGRLGLTCISWGAPLQMSWQFIATYADELYAVMSPDWIEPSGVTPGNFNRAALLADLAAL